MVYIFLIGIYWVGMLKALSAHLCIFIPHLAMAAVINPAIVEATTPAATVSMYNER